MSVNSAEFHLTEDGHGEATALVGKRGSVTLRQLFDSNHPPTCEPNNGQPMSPIANDHAIVVKITDLDQKIANK